MVQLRYRSLPSIFVAAVRRMACSKGSVVPWSPNYAEGYQIEFRTGS
jgi:hypothetical protein